MRIKVYKYFGFNFVKMFLYKQTKLVKKYDTCNSFLKRIYLGLLLNLKITFKFNTGIIDKMS